jgi:hypothetical protein
MRMTACRAIAVIGLALPGAAIAQDWHAGVVMTPPVKLAEQLIGTWYEIDARGVAKKSMFTPGIEACAYPADSEFGGDLSVRRDKGFQLALLKSTFKQARASAAVDGSALGVQLGPLAIYAMKPAADGSPRIYVRRGSNEFDMRMQKCPAKAG